MPETPTILESYFADNKDDWTMGGDFEEVLTKIASNVERNLLQTVAFEKYHNAAELFADEDFKTYMRMMWPIFCANINSIYTQNDRIMQEVGKMRELAIIYLFARFMGEQAEYRPISDDGIAAAEKGKDWYMFDRPVSCKTISHCKNGFRSVKISWIEDKEMARQVEANWQPQYDLLLCRIKWGSEDEGFYYLSDTVQREAIQAIGRENAISTMSGYSKGTILTKAAMDAMITHPDALFLPIKMPAEPRDANFRDKMFDTWYQMATTETL